MPRTSAGLLLHRVHDGHRQVLLVHPGGPFWAKKDDGAWSIPKGEHGPDDDPLTCAEREVAEELGQPAPAPSASSEDHEVHRGGAAASARTHPAEEGRVR